MKDHEVTREQPLLDESGRIAEPGWARRQIWKYDREKIRASAFRIRERDRYVVMGDEFGAVFTLADNGYFGLQSVSLADFRDKRDHTETMLSLFPMGKMKMPPSSSQGDVIWKDKRLRMEFRPDAGRRKILCDMKEFWQGKPFYCEITLEQPESDSIVTAASRRGGKTFCYEQKINCMRAEGYLFCRQDILVRSGKRLRHARLGTERHSMGRQAVLEFRQRDCGREAIRIQYRLRTGG